MSKINYAIGPAVYEIVRAKIASILADELAGQIGLNQAIIDDPGASSEAKEIAAFNIECIPDKVWEERFRRPQDSDYPMINVVFVNAPLDEGSSHSYQIGVDKYQIEFYQNAKKTNNKWGDELASLKLHRLAAICRGILMDRNYNQFDLPSHVGLRDVRDILIAQPEDGNDDAYSSIYGKFDVMVKVTETVNDLSGNVLNISYSEMRLFEEDKGYFWQINN